MRSSNHFNLVSAFSIQFKRDFLPIANSDLEALSRFGTPLGPLGLGLNFMPQLDPIPPFLVAFTSSTS